MEPIRVLMVFTIMNRGGAESMVMSYYRNVDRSKVQFDFLVHRSEKGAYEDEIEQLGGRIYRLIPFHPLTFGKYKTLVSKFFDEHHEYQIIHGHCSELGYFIYREAYRRGIPNIIAHAHNPKASFDPKWPFRTWFKHRMRKFLTKEFACSEDAASWLFGKLLAKEAIIQRNAIDTYSFRFNAEYRKQIREEFNVSDDTILVGHVGRFEKQKNHIFLIDVFDKLLAQKSNFRLLLVGGTGDLEETIHKKVRDRNLEDKVFFAGNRDDVSHVLCAMDVFLFPSLYEGFGIALLEAQSTGLPCVISDSIVDEVKVTDLIHQESLNTKLNKWVESVLENISYPISREEYYLQIMEAGYDIKQNAEWLQNYYLSLVQ